MNPLIIIDSNYLGHRAKHATGPLSYKGRPTGVIYGFLLQLHTIAETLRPSNVVFCWDSRQSHRRRKYPFYKSGRRSEEGPDEETLEAFKQFQELRTTILPRLGFKNNFHQTGYEADDLIAILVQHLPQHCIVCSSDDDLLQLLDDCDIYNLGKKKLIKQEDFEREYELLPAAWVEVKKLAGCSGDNVPGIAGVGEKTAAQYLAGRLKESTKKYQAIVNVSADMLERNDWLVRLPLPGTKLPEIKANQFDQREFEKLCRQLGFNHLPKMLDWYMYF